MHSALGCFLQIVLAVKVLLIMIIPDTPADVELAIARDHYRKQQRLVVTHQLLDGETV